MDQLLAPVVDAVQNKKKVTFFQGAGISTSVGIPDFRSPKTGLYANLQRLGLPYPEAVFDIDYFKKSPDAFYTLAHELYPGKFVPSKYHYLIRLFQDKKLLKRVYTQNIDTLERIAGVEDEFMIEAHGSFANNHCIDCDAEMSTDDLRKHMFNRDVNKGIPRCPECNGYVKPDIVFFGESLPGKFFETWDDDSDDVEVAIVAGTSLTVYPFAALPSEVGKKTLRVLINNEIVGDFKAGKRKTDICVIEDCDVVAEKLAELLGWSKELDKLVYEGRKKIEADGKETQPTEATAKELAHEIEEAAENVEGGKPRTIIVKESKDKSTDLTEDKDTNEDTAKDPDNTSEDETKEFADAIAKLQI